MLILADAFSHVVDTTFWEFLTTGPVGFNVPFGLSKFVILEFIAVVLIFLTFGPLAKRMADNQPPTSKWDSFLEWLLAIVRDLIVRPNLGGHHDKHGHHGHHIDPADRYVPFFWSLFFFIFFNNALGLVPFMGSATASFAATSTLAIIAFISIHGMAIASHGIGDYIGHHFPHIKAPFGLGPLISALIGVIELFGHFIKAFVLSVRLFANMFAGHLVLAFILSFILMAKDNLLAFWPVSIGSGLLVAALMVLELFVAALQAYVFTYLTALFMGTALHPQH